jgi:hypothetical protein
MQRVILPPVFLFLCMNLFAQRIRLNQSFGLAGTITDASGSRNLLDTLRSDYTLRVKTFGIVYSPRIDIAGSKDFSISIAAPMMLGMSFTNKYRSVETHPFKKDTIEGLRGSHIAFELPVIADINIGLYSAADESTRTFGVFAGAGYIYSYTKIKTTGGKIPFDRWEPILRAGIRMGSSWEKRWSIVFNIRGKLEGGATKTYGLQIVKEI